MTVLFVERLAQKTKVFQQWLDQTANDWENVLFIALAKGFGLSVNGLAFAAIAQSIPFLLFDRPKTMKNWKLCYLVKQTC